jgi:hypothetical protein
MQAGKLTLFQSPKHSTTRHSTDSQSHRLADQSVDVLKHITLRGGVWPNACAASIRDLSRHLNKPSSSRKNASKPPEEADHSSQPPNPQQFPSSRFANPYSNSAAEPADGLSTLAGAAEVHGTFDPQNHHPRTAVMAGSGYGQQHYHNDSGNTNNNVHGDPTSSANTAASYIPNATFTAPDATYNTHASSAGGIGGNNNNNTFPSSTTLPHPPNFNAHGGYNPDFPSAPFSQPANQPLSSSSAANWPPSDGLFDLNNVELFAGFDIPFWLDDEQYVPFLDG